jgi:hypothetical protein
MTRAQFWEAFRRVEDDLWKAARLAHPTYIRGPYDGWVLCPRAYAQAHQLRCIVELTPESYPGLPGLLWLVKEQFKQINRYFPGDDLVFAVGDIQ